MHRYKAWKQGLMAGLLWLVLLAPAAWALDCTSHFPIKTAERSVWVNGQLLHQGPVSLPDTLERNWRTEGFRARYVLDVSACTQENGHGLWLYRVGAPYRIAIDGQDSLPELPQTDRGWIQGLNGRTPMLYALPQGTQQVAIELLSIPYIPAGIAQAWVGSMTALLPEHLTGYEYHSSGMFFVSAVTVLLGLATALLWQSRRHDNVIFWFSMMCLVWGIRGTFYSADAVYLPPLWFEHINPLMVALFAVSCFQTTLLLLQKQTQQRHRLLMGIGAGFVLAFLATLLIEQGALVFRISSFLFGLIMLGAMPFLMISGREQLGLWRAGLMAFGFAALFGASLNDMLIVVGWLPPYRTSYILAGFSALLLAYALICAEFVMRSLNQAESSNELLEARVQEKTRELERSYALLRESERASARAMERARLNREIHDGLGAQLITALRGVERGALNREQMVQTLQEGLDELRMLMDSSDLGRSLYSALVSWRNRWDARLQANGIQLLWSVSEELEHIELGSDATLQIMRVLQESVANALKHAGAQSIRVQAWREYGIQGGDTLELQIQDNGKGMTTNPEPRRSGRGLRHMVQRAEMVGAQISISNTTPPDTGVSVRLSMAWPKSSTASGLPLL